MTSTAFLIIAFLTGIAGALQTPTLSLFLTSQVYVSPFMVGIFFTGSAVIGIFVSQLLATWSDKRGDRKTLILYCCLLGALACGCSPNHAVVTGNKDSQNSINKLAHNTEPEAFCAS